MRTLLLRLVINGLGLYIASQLVSGIRAPASWATFVAIAAIFALVNALVRPLLKLFAVPLIILTLGLFTLVINALMLWLTGAISTTLGLGFSVSGFVPAFLGALVVGIVNWGLTLILGGSRGR